MQLRLAAIALAMLALTGLSRRSLAADGDAAAAPTVTARAEDPPGTAQAPKEGTATAGPEIVTVGIYFYFVRGLDLRSNSYTADFYIWFRWKGDYNPTKSFEFMNALGNPAQKAIFV